jgi:hypothetical protein
MCSGQDARDAEVSEQCMAVRDQDVLGLHVAMHESRAMRVVESRADLVGDAKCIAEWKLAVLFQAIAKRAAGDVGRHIVQQAAGVARVDQGNEVWMRQLRRDSNLSEKARRLTSRRAPGATP